MYMTTNSMSIPLNIAQIAGFFSCELLSLQETLPDRWFSCSFKEIPKASEFSHVLHSLQD